MKLLDYRRRGPGTGGILALGALAAVLGAAAILITALAALIAVVAIVVIVAACLILAVPALRLALLALKRWLEPTTRGAGAVDERSWPPRPERVLVTRRSTLPRR